MAITASEITTANTLEQLRTQFNSLVTDVTGLESGTLAHTEINTTTISATTFNLNEDGTFVFEGATSNAFETTLTVTDPTADRTITLPNATGTVLLGTLANPDSADGAALGSTALEWSDLYLADGAVIYFGADQDIPLTHVADTGLRFDDSDKLMFGTGNDLQLHSNGSAGLLTSTTFTIYSDCFGISNAGATETIMTADVDGAVTLYYDNTAALATKSGGGTLTGTWETTTALVPDASDGAALGTTALEWSDLYLADGAVLNFGDDQDVTLTHVHDSGLTLSTTGANDTKLTIHSTATDADAAPTITLHRDSASPADNDLAGIIGFAAENSASEPTNWAQIYSTLLDVTDATEDGDLKFTVITNGSNTTPLTLKGSGLIVPDAGTIGSASATTAMTISSAGIVTFVDDILIKDAGTIGSASAATAIAISSAGVVALSATTEASAIGTAALTVAGGIGVTKDMWIGDDIVMDSDSCVLNFGDDQDVALTHVHNTGLLFTSGHTTALQLQFGDSGTYIYQSADGVLDLVSDTEIEINATLIDVNGNLDVSGTGVIAGAITGAAITASGILKTDDTTAATSTTDGSLQTDGGLSVAADAVIGDDLIMLSDAAVVHFGADKDVTLTHVADSGLLIKNTIAVGNTASATGSNSQALGYSALASGDQATAIGYDATASGDNSQALGYSALASGASGVAIGYDPTASGDHATAIGYQMTASGDHAIGFGYQGDVSGDHSKLFTLDTTSRTLSQAAALSIMGGNVGIGTLSPASPLSVVGDITATLTIQPAGDTATGDNAAIGYTSVEGLILTGQGSTGDVTIKNDADAVVAQIPTGTTGVDFKGNIFTSTAGTSNFVAGVNAGNSIASGGNYNTVVGDEAGTAITTGDSNTAVGYAALDAVTTASNNTAVGFAALSANTSGNANIAVGYGALDANTIGVDNTASGFQALSGNTEGNYNTASGNNALYSNTTGSYNTASGRRALFTNTIGATNAAVGASALDLNTEGGGNAALGYNCLSANTTANNNVAVGYQALLLNTTGTTNIGIGSTALDANTTASNNIAVGFSALGATTTGPSNIAIGSYALYVNTTGQQNIAIGYQALDANVDTHYNVAVGQSALSANTGTYNTGLGTYTLQNNTTASNNTAVGYAALLTNTTGALNVATGQQALYLNTTGAGNVATGYTALYTNTTGNYNTATGYQALYANTTALNNTAMAAFALFTNATGNYNNAFGYASMYDNTTGVGNSATGYVSLTNNTTGGYNVANGYAALQYNTTANYNTGLGYNALGAVNTGGQNTGVGTNAGDSITDGTYNVCLGYQTDISAAGGANQISIGTNVNCSANSQVSIGQSGSAVRNLFAVDNAWTQSSDIRKKKDIEDAVLGLDFVNDLRPVTYEWKPNYEFPKDFAEYNEENLMTLDVRMHGLVAQEVKAALDKAGVERFAGWEEDPDGCQRISKEMFVFPLIKAVQELSAEINKLKEKLNE